MRHASLLSAAVVVAVMTAIGVSVWGSGEVRAADTVSVKTCTGGKVSLKVAEKRMLELHNRKRVDRGVKRLCVHSALQKAARAHSRDMIQRDYFAHGNVGRRLKRHGYNWSRWGENIAPDPGSPSPRGTFAKWMDSSGHRSNILNGKFREVGIGLATGSYKGERTTMWTVDFGSRR